MVKSKYVHLFRVEDKYVYYNSLYLNPVYLSENQHNELLKYLSNINSEKLDDDFEEMLVRNKILIENEDEDELLINNARSNIVTPYPVIVYFILSENCNLSCKYCFLGNSICRETMPSMTRETAEKALLYYSKQIRLKPEWYSHQKEFIFYGGEPLINFDVLKFIVNRTKEMQENGELPQKIKFSMVTNGLLLDDEKIEFLKNNNILTSISVDGLTSTDNSSRVDKNGKPIYDRLLKVLENVKRKKWNVGLSITLTPSTIRDADHIFELLNVYGISDISFNVLHSTEDYPIPKDYYEKANEFIINFYVKSRGKNIFEDRMMRKIDSFANGKIYYSDCAATSGSQIVIIPDGRVGVCHGCLESKEYFSTDIFDEKPIEENQTFMEWSQITPLNKEECMDCEALGICGGGCPINGRNTTENGNIHSIDKPFCIHSKKILNFMIEYLYKLAKE